MTEQAPYSIPKQSGGWRAIVLAIAVHAALFAFLWIGIRWQSETPIAIEAEVWNLQTKEAAPLPEPQPTLRVEPELKTAPPKPVEKEPEIAKPDIALEQEKKRKEKEKLEQQRLAEQKEAEKRKQERERIEQEKKEKLLAKQKEEAEKRKQQEAEAKRQEAEAKRQAQVEKMRKEEMRRIAGAVGTGGTGDAPKSQGMRGDPKYADRIRAKIRSHTIYAVPNDLQGNPSVEYDVKLFPDGTLRGAPRKLKSSGIPAFDEAVRRAIELSQPFPPDKSGAVPSELIVSHQPKEQ
jgi:colicin import membrane protein